MRFGRQDVFWLSLALLFHLPLFLVPLTTPDPGPKASRILSVILATGPSAKTIEATKTEYDPTPAAPKPETFFDPLPPEYQPPPAAVQKPPVFPDPGPTVSTATLIDAASRFKWPLPETTPKRQLGDRPSAREAEYGQSRFNSDADLFESRTRPERTEVLDRWVSSDGSQNVVITTAAGQTLCGRAPSWDPLNPLMEHVMQFRTCGGGGKRSIKMPNRFTGHLVD